MIRPAHQARREAVARQAAEVFQSSIISWSSKIIEDGMVDSSHRTWGSLQDSSYSRVYSSKSATSSSGAASSVCRSRSRCSSDCVRSVSSSA